MAATYTHAKEQGQMSVGWKRTEGRTDGGDCTTSRANMVGSLTIVIVYQCNLNRGPLVATFDEIIQHAFSASLTVHRAWA